MGTDRSETYRGTCLCGGGEFIVWFCVPDHPYPTRSRWLEAESTCPDCRSKYVLVEQYGKVEPVTREVAEERERLSREYWARRKSVIESTSAQAVVDGAVRRLESMSKVKAYGILASVTRSVGYHSVETFRRHLRESGSMQRWLQSTIGPDDIRALMDWLGHSDEELVEALDDLSNYGTQEGRLPTAGVALCDGIASTDGPQVLTWR